MDEILKNLLSSELLSEEVKAEISTKWTSAVEQYKKTVREEVTGEVRAEIAEQWSSERDTLIESVNDLVTKTLTEEIEELKGDIERFRDLEAEYAAKIVEEKHEMSDKLNEELEELINKMDAFFELRLAEEFEELREDLEIVKQNEFGRRIFEAFASEFNVSYVDEESTQAKLTAALAQVMEAEEEIKSLQEAQSAALRESTLQRVLAPLNGVKREQMAFVLANVSTDKLEEAYTHFIGRVLKEDKSSEGAAALRESTVVTGDETVVENAGKTDKHAQLRKLAGINQ